MDDDWRCPELDKFVDYIIAFTDSGQPLPESFLEHARSCKHCLFWASWNLAALKAMRTTNRGIRSASQCPPRSHFERLLCGSVFGLLDKSVEKIDKNVYLLNSLQEMASLHPAVNHIDRDSPAYCRSCRSYYDAVFAAMVESQKFYEDAIKNGDEIREIEDISQEVDYEQIGYKHKKPD